MSLRLSPMRNFRTGETDWRDLEEIPTEELKDYMAQWPELHGLFDTLILMGKDSLVAYRECLQESVKVYERNNPDLRK